MKALFYPGAGFGRIVQCYYCYDCIAITTILTRNTTSRLQPHKFATTVCFWKGAVKDPGDRGPPHGLCRAPTIGERGGSSRRALHFSSFLHMHQVRAPLQEMILQ